MIKRADVKTYEGLIAKALAFWGASVWLKSVT